MANVVLSDEAKTLLKEASQSSSGTIYYLKDGRGTTIQSNGKTFVSSLERRVVTFWEAGLRSLIEKGLVEQADIRGDIFQVTAAGYTLADSICTPEL